MPAPYISEAEAVERVEQSCRSHDFERNGVKLDEIVTEFLRGHGYVRLAAAVAETKAWRA